MFDLIIRNGILVDGQRRPRYEADLGISGDRITEIGQLADAVAPTEIDARGKIVAPGFIDVHAHSDAALLTQPHLLSKTTQGFTTEFLMLDGISYAPVNDQTVHGWIQYLRALNGLRFEQYTGWKSIAEFMGLFDRRAAQNVAAFVPYANVRTLALVEVLFAQAVAYYSFKQPLSARELSGVALIVVGVALLVAV